VTVSAERTDDRVTVAVADNGPGVDESARERIFEIFERGGTDAEGTGIGLALCRRIVERHDGDIWVESPPGEGATFKFTLPAVQERHNA
jgi:signal transduction histidine kinase